MVGAARFEITTPAGRMIGWKHEDGETVRELFMPKGSWLA